jgi:hypothetical protein
MASTNYNPATVADDLGVLASGSTQITSVDQIMMRYAKLFIDAAEKRINERGKVDTGKMSDIEISTVQFVNGKWSMTIGYDKNNPASKYYDFQNKGVKGLKSGSPNSVYAFRTLNVSTKMVDALMQWYMRHRNYIKNETQKKGLSKLQTKRKKIGSVVSKQNNLRQIAEATAKRIKERGIKRIGFFEDNMNVFGADFQKELALAMGKNIVVGIKQVVEGKQYGNNNK